MDTASKLFAIDPDGSHAMALFGYRAGNMYDGDGVGRLTARSRRHLAHGARQSPRRRARSMDRVAPGWPASAA